jgi:hypothetical protein
MRIVLALALLVVSAARAQDFSIVSVVAAGAIDYAAISKGFDPKLVSRISRLETRTDPLQPRELANDRSILPRLTLEDGPAFMKLANSVPTAACHPKGSRGKRSQRNLGLAAADTSAKSAPPAIDGSERHDFSESRRMTGPMHMHRCTIAGKDGRVASATYELLDCPDHARSTRAA